MVHRALIGAALASAVALTQAAAIQHPFKAAQFQQPDSTPPTEYPHRPLPWGEINVLHTTDTYVNRTMGSPGAVGASGARGGREAGVGLAQA